MRSSIVSSAHPARALLPPLEVLAAQGISRQECLRGTGLLSSTLEDPQTRMSVQQELRFFRNVLALTDDPCIGLAIGEPFTPQRYGLFGYALMSAETFRHALVLVQKFSRLTFSFFDFEFGVEGDLGYFFVASTPDLEPALFNLFHDREMSAAWVAFNEILGYSMSLKRVHLPHDGLGHTHKYEQYFGCEVRFNTGQGRLYFDSALLDKRLPQGDPDSSRRLQQQCQMLVARMSPRGELVNEVRLMILSRSGFIPDIDYVAEKMGVSVRTLRRRLKAEGHGFRELVDEARFNMAREYLERTLLSLEGISDLLGYSEPANFTHAFRRWSGDTPSHWRECHIGPDGAEHLIPANFSRT